MATHAHRGVVGRVVSADPWRRSSGRPHESWRAAGLAGSGQCRARQSLSPAPERQRSTPPESGPAVTTAPQPSPVGESFEEFYKSVWDMAQNCRSCIIARPTLPHTNPMESEPGNTFSAQNKKNQKFDDFRPKETEGHFLTPHTPPPHLPQNLKKVGFKWGGSGPKTLGDAFLQQNNDFTEG